MSTPKKEKETPKPEEPTLSPEELKAQKEKFEAEAMAKIFGNAKPPAKAKAEEPPPVVEDVPAGEAPPEEPEIPAEPEKPEEPAKETPAEPEAPETPAPLPAAAIDETMIEKVVERTLERSKPAPPPAPPTPATFPAGVQLDVQDERRLEVLRKMESMNLDPKYKGIADRTIKFWQAEEKWIEDWMSAHPEEEFAEDNPEYVKWLARNEPAFSPEHFELAKEALIEERVLAKVSKEREVRDKELTEKQKRELEMSQFKEANAAIVQAADASIVQFIAAAEEGFKDQVAGKTKVDEAASKALMETNPLAYNVLVEEGEELHAKLVALDRWARFPENPALHLNRQLKLGSGRRLNPHLDLVTEIQEIEREFEAMPKTETRDGDGRDFASLAAFEAAMSRIEKGNGTPEEKQAAREVFMTKHWLLSPEEIRTLLINRSAATAKNRIARYNVGKPSTQNTPAPPAGETPPEPPAPPKPKPTPAPVISRGTATVSASDVADKGKQTVVSQQQADEIITRKMGWAV